MGTVRTFWSGFWDGISMSGLMSKLSLPHLDETPLFEPEPEASAESIWIHAAAETSPTKQTAEQTLVERLLGSAVEVASQVLIEGSTRHAAALALMSNSRGKVQLDDLVTDVRAGRGDVLLLALEILMTQREKLSSLLAPEQSQPRSRTK